MTEAADLVVRGGRVFTLDDARPWAEGIAVRGDRILAVDRDSAIAELAGPSTITIDAGGGLVLPGFVDSHDHVRLGTPDALDLSAATSVEHIHALLAAHVRADPSLEWIEAGRWTYGAIPGGRTPTVADLPDAVTRGAPRSSRRTTPTPSG